MNYQFLAGIVAGYVGTRCLGAYMTVLEHNEQRRQFVEKLEGLGGEKDDFEAAQISEWLSLPRKTAVGLHYKHMLPWNATRLLRK